MSRLEVRLLGGFEVWHGDQPVDGFESQKVRALLAYLVLHRDVAHSRDRLAGLLWPEKDDDTARRNLRQAVYNLRTTLPHGDTSSSPILSSHQSVQFNYETDYWLDIAAFEDRLHRGMSASSGVDPQLLAEASELYRGDFLTGFFVADSPAFEHWLLYEQERLREMAIQALRRLVDYYLACSEYRRGTKYARRLLEIDPLFEEAHRKLMRLYALSGRRSRSLTQYEQCRSLLRTDLGVEPLEETTTLYRAILAEEWPVQPTSGEGEPAGPYIPLVGREAAYARLRHSWEATRRGEGRLTLVEGETGIGKTHLIETFIRDVAAQTHALVLSGKSWEFAPQVGYLPFAEAIQRVVTDQAQLVQQAMAGMPSQRLADLALIVPDLRTLRPDLPAPASLSYNGAHRRLFEAVACFIEALAQAPGLGRPAASLILFLDDLHRADRSTLELLQHLVYRLNTVPVWIVAAHRAADLNLEHPLLPLRSWLSRDQRVDRVALDRLSPSDIQRIAEAIVGNRRADLLARFLDRESAGLPLTIIELINYLCDEGVLVNREDNRWSLTGSLPALATPTAENLDNLILERVSRLPTSARRLLTLSAVIGPQIDAELLQETDGEHMAVVEASIDMWLERRLVRPVLRDWIGAAPGADTIFQAGTPPKKRFEFAHARIRLAIYNDVNPQRRKVMHRQVAITLLRRHAGDTEPVCEALAHHFVAAEVWDRAFTYLKQAGDKARQAIASETALHYYDQALEVLDRLQEEAVDKADREAYLEGRFQVLASRAQVYGVRGVPDKQKADLQRMKDIAQELNRPDHLSLVVAQLDTPQSSV